MKSLIESSAFAAESVFDNKIETEWLTTEDAANYLRVSVGVVRNLTSNGKIPYRKWGKRNRYLLRELRELLLSQERRGPYGN